MPCSSVVLTGRSAVSPVRASLVSIKVSNIPALEVLWSPRPDIEHPPFAPVSDNIIVRDATSYFTPPHYQLQAQPSPTMPPKATVGPEEDVKFLLTVIQQMAGAVSAYTLFLPREPTR